MAQIAINSFMTIMPAVRVAPKHTFWTTYDDNADVLYINFNQSGVADDSELTADDVIVRYKNGNIIGLTIMNASQRKI